MRSRLIKYQQHCDDYKHRLQRSDKRSKSGNNPLFAYPSIPPPIQFDPKYDIGNVDNYTKFAGRTIHDGKDVNLLETVGKRLSSCFRAIVPVQEVDARENGCTAILEISRRSQRAAVVSASIQVSREIKVSAHSAIIHEKRNDRQNT